MSERITEDEYAQLCQQITSRTPSEATDEEFGKLVCFLAADLSSTDRWVGHLGPPDSHVRKEVTEALRMIKDGTIRSSLVPLHIRPATHHLPKTGDTVIPLHKFLLVRGYHLLAELGRGGSGVVFRARPEGHQSTDQVAVKLLNRDPFREGTMGRVETVRETMAHYVFQHPNIARLLSSGQSANHGPYIVMEFVQGLNLEQWVAKHKPMTPRDAAAVIEVLAKALQVVHNENVVHCDFKPNNVLGCSGATLDINNLKIGDFGLAHLATAGEVYVEESTATSGTLPYLAPERLSGRVSRRADIYALGVTFLYLLTGSVTHDQEQTNRLNMLKAIHGTGPHDESFRSQYESFVEELRQTVAGNPRVIEEPILRAIIAKCLSLRPEDRYPSAAALAADLQRWSKDQLTETSGYFYTTKEKWAQFFKRCRRKGEEFEEDQKKLWGSALVLLAVPSLVLSLLSTCLILNGWQPELTNMATGMSYAFVFVVPTCFVLWWKFHAGRVVGRIARFLVSYVGAAIILQTMVFPDDSVLFARVILVVAGLAFTYLGLFEQPWKYSFWSGIALLIASVPIGWLWSTYPETFGPWAAFVIGTVYGLFFFAWGFKYLTQRGGKRPILETSHSMDG